MNKVNRSYEIDILNYFDDKKLFDEVVLSGDINIVKPNPRIFKIMVDS